MSNPEEETNIRCGVKEQEPTRPEFDLRDNRTYKPASVGYSTSSERYHPTKPNYTSGFNFGGTTSGGFGFGDSDDVESSDVFLKKTGQEASKERKEIIEKLKDSYKNNWADNKKDKYVVLGDGISKEYYEVAMTLWNTKNGWEVALQFSETLNEQDYDDEDEINDWEDMIVDESTDWEEGGRMIIRPIEKEEESVNGMDIKIKRM